MQRSNPTNQDEALDNPQDLSRTRSLSGSGSTDRSDSSEHSSSAEESNPSTPIDFPFAAGSQSGDEDERSEEAHDEKEIKDKTPTHAEDQNVEIDLLDLLQMFGGAFQQFNPQSIRATQIDHYNQHLEEISQNLEHIKRIMLALKHQKTHYEIEQNQVKLNKLSLEPAPSQDYQAELLQQRLELSKKHKKITDKEAELQAQQQTAAAAQARRQFAGSIGLVFSVPRSAAASPAASAAPTSTNEQHPSETSPLLRKK